MQRKKTKTLASVGPYAMNRFSIGALGGTEWDALSTGMARSNAYTEAFHVAVGAANYQIALDSRDAFIVLDPGRMGLARPLQAGDVMAYYERDVKDTLGNSMDTKALGKLHRLRAARGYDATTGSILLNSGVRLIHKSTWRSLQPGPAGLGRGQLVLR